MNNTTAEQMINVKVNGESERQSGTLEEFKEFIADPPEWLEWFTVIRPLDSRERQVIVGQYAADELIAWASATADEYRRLVLQTAAADEVDLRNRARGRQRALPMRGVASAAFPILGEKECGRLYKLGRECVKQESFYSDGEDEWRADGPFFAAYEVDQDAIEAILRKERIPA